MMLSLLKRLVPPSDREVIINGRVFTLRELGAGFHPDWMGGENVSLNASLLSLSKVTAATILL